MRDAWPDDVENNFKDPSADALSTRPSGCDALAGRYERPQMACLCAVRCSRSLLNDRLVSSQQMTHVQRSRARLHRRDSEHTRSKT